MSDKIEQLQILKERAELLFQENRLIKNPYFDKEITLNADGLHHLQFSARRERNKDEQILKLRLLPLAIKVLRRAGTLQQYRKELMPIGKTSVDGFRATKWVQSWGFEAIFKQIKVRTIVRQVGDGKLVFWSVMLLEKDSKRLAKGLEIEE